jgi:hypothetical protein
VKPVTADTCLAALDAVSGRVFAVDQCFQHLAIPAALFSGLVLCLAASFLGNPSLRRTLVLTVLNYFQAGQFYGLLSWLPALLICRAFTILRRLRSL